MAFIVTVLRKGSINQVNRRQKGEADGALLAPTVASETMQDVPIFLSGPGTVQASNTVAVRSQIGGTPPLTGGISAWPLTERAQPP
jgi:hypothetical protein